MSMCIRLAVLRGRCMAHRVCRIWLLTAKTFYFLHSIVRVGVDVAVGYTCKLDVDTQISGSTAAGGDQATVIIHALHC